MAKRIVGRRELLDRWRGIEEDEDDESLSSIPYKQRQIRQRKEEWFSDTFNFLISLSKETHIWCGNWDLMGPLLETFYNYFKDTCTDSPRKILWKRISEELRQCTQCICQHHQAQETYNTEYESDTVGPLLNVLRSMDEERVTEHLKEINARIATREYDPESHNIEVVSIMFEVLMFPILLDDQSLFNEFQSFLEAIDSSHELALAGHQQYPGVYALLFLKSGGARSIGFRLAGCMGKLRRAADLEPLQPLLKKCISLLETEVLPSTSEASRPRVQLERLTVWLGIKSLLGFLEPPAFEEGILERYPIFLSIVLNHVSDDTLDFTYAINCLRLLFEMLGCKLWLRTTFSPSVMRNTLLGQCFHTRNEKSHKEIFDIFQPFLQSLEALQDGEHERQRRHFIYFLLYQVTQSSNFSFLMRKKARQIALLIIHRGYTMDPPCPPFECAHMWGPSLVSSLKDSSLHSSLRQPAFDLIHTIMVSDASALISLKSKYLASQSYDAIILDSNDDEDEIPFVHDVEEKESSCWSEFSVQSKLTSRECKEWMCVPMLWVDVLIGLDPSALPITFSKAVFWALSRFPMVEPESSTEMDLPIKDWLSSYAGNISSSFGWEVPNGSDDGGNGKEMKNSVRASSMCVPLIRTFKRCAAHYVVQMEQGDLRKQWTWEPRMAESLILLLVEPNDNVRQVGRVILEHVSKTRGLASGLQFLCSCASSLSAIYLGLRHGLKLVLLDYAVSNFHNLHHLFFIVHKLLMEVVESPEKPPSNPVDGSNRSKFLSEGGFLRQPVFERFPVSTYGCLNIVDQQSWDKFCCLLSGILWPSVAKCLVEGKTFIDNKRSQMTCVRLLVVLPVVFERLSSSVFKLSGISSSSVPRFFDFKWLRDLMDWGKSSLVVIGRHWKQCVRSLITLFKGSFSVDSAHVIVAIEKLISCDTVAIDELKDHVSKLSVLLSAKNSSTNERKPMKIEPCLFEGVSFERKYSVKEHFTSDDTDVCVLEKVLPQSKTENKVIVLSDDEADTLACPDVVIISRKGSSQHLLDDKKMVPASGKTLNQNVDNMKPNSSKNLLGAFKLTKVDGRTVLSSQNQDNGACRNKSLSAESFSSLGDTATSQIQSEVVEEKQCERIYACNVNESYISCGVTDFNYVNSHGLTVDNRNSGQPSPIGPSNAGDNLQVTDMIKKEFRHDTEGDPWERVLKFERHPLTKHSNAVQQERNYVSRECETPTSKSINVELETRDNVLKELVRDAESDPWEHALKVAARTQSLSTKPLISAPKRQVIQLKMPIGNRSAHIQRLDPVVKRFKPPRLDDWYRPILEVDYFSIVGLSCADNDETATVTTTNLKAVPLSFMSPEHYVEIFRPLILEEFKAQLQNSYVEASLSDTCCGTICVLSVERIDDFHIIRCTTDDRESSSPRSCSENDLVLLTKSPLQNSSQNAHMVGKVEKREKDNKSRSDILLIRFYLQGGSLRLKRAQRLLTERSKWYVSRIMSITPQLREFQALSSLKDIPMLPIILSPVDRACGYAEYIKVGLEKLSLPLQQMLKSSFNDSQLEAISVAIGTHDSKRAFDLSLIQGPPGTGKTRTIVAIVSGLLALGTIRKNDGSKTLYDDPRPHCTAGKNLKAKISQSTAFARAWQDAVLARQLAKEEEKQPTRKVVCSARGRVLICAQSNAAVDELVSRISGGGLYGSDGKMYKPYLVRVGNVKTIHPSSLPFFIDTLVEQRLAEEKCDVDLKIDASDSSLTLRCKLEKLVDSIRFYETKRANLRDSDSHVKSCLEDGATKEDDEKDMSDAAIQAKLKVLYGQKKSIYADLAAAQAREKKSSEEIKSLKHKLRKAILREAEIVVTTLSGCGGDIFGVCSESTSNLRSGNSSEHSLFDAVVIDEAAQALEPATLIPLQLLKSNGTKCIMVGDPKQLPATVLSNTASRFLFECSMFERLQRAGHPVIMLAEQYRMHPEICRFPSFHFYDNKLLNGSKMDSKSAKFHENVYLSPYIFFDVLDGQEHRAKNSGALSLYNESEVDAAVEVLRFFKKRYPSEFVGGRIGIITPYKSQLSLLRSWFTKIFGSEVTADMEFNTIDGFQGREVDILILSTVRASEQSAKEPGFNSSSIGFVADVRRMNVALTRARISLWIVGNARTLRTNLNWGALLKDAQERNLVIPVARPYESIFNKALSSFRRSHSSASLDSHSKHLMHAKKTSDIGQGVKETSSNVNELHGRKSKLADGEAERHKRSHKYDSDLIGTHMKHGTSADTNCPGKDCRSSKDLEPPVTGKCLTDDPEDKSKDIKRQASNLAGMPCTDKEKSVLDRFRSESPSSNVHLETMVTSGRQGSNLAGMPGIDKEKGVSDRLRSESLSSNVQLEKKGNRMREVSKGRLGSSKNNKLGNLSRRKSVASPSSTEGCHQKKQTNDGGESCTILDNKTESIIATRKRQRDAVDALLSSALISSRKPETSSVSSVKRPSSSTTAARGATKLPNASKAQPFASTNQERAALSPHYQSRHPQKLGDRPSNVRDLNEEWKAFKDLIRDYKET